MATYETVTCTCCDIPFQRVDRTNLYTSSNDSSVTAPNADHCQDCRYHQGSTLEKRLARAETHEKKFRERLMQAKAGARKAEAAAREAREQTAAALQSRTDMARLLQDVQELHVQKLDGRCECGRQRNCPTAELVGSPRSYQFISRSASTPSRPHRPTRGFAG